MLGGWAYCKRKPASRRRTRNDNPFCVMNMFPRLKCVRHCFVCRFYRHVLTRMSMSLFRKGPYYFLAVANIVDVLLIVGHATIFGLDIEIANALADLQIQAGDQYVDLRQARLLPCVSGLQRSLARGRAAWQAKAMFCEYDYISLSDTQSGYASRLRSSRTAID